MHRVGSFERWNSNGKIKRNVRTFVDLETSVLQVESQT